MFQPHHLLVPLLLAVSVSACQDPSGVGLGVLDETGGVPGTRVIEGTNITTDVTFETTAGFSGSANNPQTRVLFGEVEDQLFGDATAVSAFDHIIPSSAEDLDVEDVTQVRLRLRRNYTYGDTLATLPVEVREITGAWEPPDLEPDTTLETGSVIFSAEISAEDTLAFLDFPESWVTTHRERLLDEDFNDDFHGFQLSIPNGTAPSPGAVLGFDMTQSSLDVITAEDTIRYPMWEVFTELNREEPTAPPSDIVPLSDGRPQALGVTFDLSEYADKSVAGGAIRFTINRNAVPSQGSFVRPIASEVGLLLLDDEGDVVLANLSVPEEDVNLGLSSAAFTQALQSFVVSEELTRRFQIAFAVDPTSLDILPISLEPVMGEGGAPRLSLTLIDPE